MIFFSEENHFHEKFYEIDFTKKKKSHQLFVYTLISVLLQTIKFDLQVDHPYTSILLFAKSLKGDRNKLQKMVQMSWTFVNDSLCTTVCLQWEPEIIAIAGILNRKLVKSNQQLLKSLCIFCSDVFSRQII